jgi:hypothetical protein
LFQPRQFYIIFSVLFPEHFGLKTMHSISINNPLFAFSSSGPSAFTAMKPTFRLALYSRPLALPLCSFGKRLTATADNSSTAGLHN